MATYKLISGGEDMLLKANGLSWASDRATLSQTLGFNCLERLELGAQASLVIDGQEFMRVIVMSRADGKFSYAYTAMDYGFYLKNEVLKQFNGSTASDAIRTLLNEYGVKSNVADIPTRITKLYKGQSIAAIIDDVLGQATDDQGVTYIKEMRLDTVVIARLDNLRITPNILIGDAKIAHSIEEMRNRIIVSGSGENPSILATAEDAAGQKQYGLLQKVESVDDKNEAQARNIAANKLKELNRITHSTSVEVVALSGGETIRANRMIQINSRWFRINSAAHTLESSRHKVNLDLEWYE
jgi:hypothetical protein